MPVHQAPLATYRLQFNSRFTFADARRLVPYLHSLGITDLYASPIFKACPGSSHGYDITDPTRLNPELGTEQDFQDLVAELEGHDLGLLLDIVPNHMAASPDNPWWADVLANGPSSSYASYFDIDWGPSDQPRLVLPVLGRPYHEALESGELALCLDEGGLYVRYYDKQFPLEIKAYLQVLFHWMDRIRRDVGDSHPALQQLGQLVTSIEALSPYYSARGRQVRARYRQAAHANAAIHSLLASEPEVQGPWNRTLAAINGQQGQPDSFDRLDSLLAQQPYRLSYWKTGRQALNYRRFFDISDLAGVRVELSHVFDATHQLVLHLADEGKVTGLRIDHIDGLQDPLGYLHHLGQSLYSQQSAAFFVVVEKILTGDETLPEEWPVAGTTGYEFANRLNAMFVDPGGFQRMVEGYKRFVGSHADFANVVYSKKKQVMTDLFPAELRVLNDILSAIASRDRYACDLTEEELSKALIEVTACMPVYRTYSGTAGPSPQDRTCIEAAFTKAQLRAQGVDPLAIDLVRRVGLGQLPPGSTPAEKELGLQFMLRWQQLTGPVMAKGLEDTALYSFNPLISLNEVGGGPEIDPSPVAAFHQFSVDRLLHWPDSMNATSTHDTKRSEDVRARIAMLSEIPDEWDQCLTRWSQWNLSRKRLFQGDPVPEPAMEVLIYQTLLGAWPLHEEEVPEFQDRIKAYVIKAAREAKQRTGWLSPNHQYEEALVAFVDDILKESANNRFLTDLLELQGRLAFYGAINSLAQVLLKVTSPGVPDFYQGTELWDLSFVDPDNRRPVDFEMRSRLLDDMKSQEPQILLDSWQDGRIKLYVTTKALEARQLHRGLFQRGEYIPLEAHGQRHNHVCAFLRHLGPAWTLTVVPRLLMTLVPGGPPQLRPDIWGDDSLPLPQGCPDRWHNVFTGEDLLVSQGSPSLRLQRVLGFFPVALLTATVRD